MSHGEDPAVDDGDRTGVWLVGARGNVATMSIVGARAIARGATDTTGMVTERDPVSSLELPPVEGFVFGGHDIEPESLVAQAERQRDRNGVPDADTLETVRDDLAAIDERIEVGTAVNCGAAVSEDSEQQTRPCRSATSSTRSETTTRRSAIATTSSDSSSSTSPRRNPNWRSRSDTTRATRSSKRSTRTTATSPASVLYAYAAISDGHPFVNFTPSAANALGESANSRPKTRFHTWDATRRPARRSSSPRSRPCLPAEICES